MRKAFNILTLVAILMAVSMTAFGQVQPTFTTLSSAVANERTNKIVVASATGFVASTGTLDYGVFIDHEFMRITAVSGTTITVTRAQAGTNATTHKSGATTYVGPYGSQQAPSNAFPPGPFVQTSYQGSCTPSNYPVNPVIQVNGGNPRLQQVMYFCNGSQWVVGSLPDDTPKDGLIGGTNIAIGSVAYASVGTNTTDITNKRMTTSFYLPRTGIFTGIQVLQGGTATTDNITTQIADASGNILATSAAAGTLLSGANTFASIAFALNGAGAAQTKTILVGPALYFVSVVGNGTAAGAYQTVPTATFKNILSQGTTSITFGTFPAYVPPTTFTADLAPVVALYY